MDGWMDGYIYIYIYIDLNEAQGQLAFYFNLFLRQMWRKVNENIAPEFD
jgi:hypothetical protein